MEPQNSIYDDPTERYVVSLIVSYTREELEPGIEDPSDEEEWAKQAAAAALDLTRDEASPGTMWFVFDRKERKNYRFEQEDFEGRRVP